MRHFGFLHEHETAALFAVPPRSFDRHSPAWTLALALGATLYSPGTRADLAADAARAARIGAASVVWDLEDAVPHARVEEAEQNTARGIVALSHHDDDGDIPLLFVRVRDTAQVDRIAAQVSPARLNRLTGFVLPKVDPNNANAMLDAVERASGRAGRTLFAMPVLETPEIAWTETRRATLLGLREVFDAHKDTVLAVRVGGTDLCGLFGLRRDSNTVVWDIAVVRDVLADILNTFARRGDYVVTGPVWEHFSGDRMFKPSLRTTPFKNAGLLKTRQSLVDSAADELIRETVLDRANGMCGKTVIHPTRVAPVNALLAVTREEHDDALAVLAAAQEGGAVASASRNKMNEMGPHVLWAEQVALRAAVYGVLHEQAGALHVLQKGRDAAAAEYGRRTQSEAVQGVAWQA